MSYWKETLINFGTVKKGKTLNFTFEALITIPPITDVSVSCGCTKAKYDIKVNKMLVTYKAGEIPKHLENHQAVNQRVTVTYLDGTTEQLQIIGTKIR
jgi:hypothetical protein